MEIYTNYNSKGPSTPVVLTFIVKQKQTNKELETTHLNKFT